MSTKKVLTLLVIVSALAFITTAQDDPNLGFQGGADGQFSEENLKLQQDLIEIQRTKLWGCYFLTKNKLYSQNKEIAQLAVGKTGEAVLTRMTTDIMKRCMSNIQPDEAQRVLDTFVKADFRVEDWDNLHNFSVKDYEGENVVLDLEPEEKFIYEYYQKIDENVKNQWEEQAEKEDIERRRKVDYEPKIGGISLKETSPFVKFLYAVLVISGIAGVFLFAYRRLFTEGQETPYEKVKRERREKKKVKTT